jgi:hypothetical protein
MPDVRPIGISAATAADVPEEVDLMTAGSIRGGRMPRDVRARERLREAQQREAEAVAAVCAANHALGKARAKRDDALTAANAAVKRAQQAVDAARGELVKVSGLERTALLLGINPSELRKTPMLRRRAES